MSDQLRQAALREAIQADAFIGRAPSSEAPAEQTADLQAAIMNLPAGVPPVPDAAVLSSSDEVNWSNGYKAGHRDARHAAAELVAASLVAGASPTAQPADLFKLAQECGATVYRNRANPHAPAVAFGDESWARFVAALSPTAQEGQQP